MNVNVVDQSGRSGGMGQVDGINEIRDKGLMPMPSQNGEIDANRSSSLEEQQREERRIYGEIGAVVQNAPF